LETAALSNQKILTAFHFIKLQIILWAKRLVPGPVLGQVLGPGQGWDQNCDWKGEINKPVVLRYSLV